MGNTLIEKDENVLLGNSHSGSVFGIGKADETPPSNALTCKSLFLFLTCTLLQKEKTLHLIAYRFDCFCT